jgi:hypothetical protein
METTDARTPRLIGRAHGLDPIRPDAARLGRPARSDAVDELRLHIGRRTESAVMTTVAIDAVLGQQRRIQVSALLAAAPVGWWHRPEPGYQIVLDEVCDPGHFRFQNVDPTRSGTPS